MKDAFSIKHSFYENGKLVGAIKDSPSSRSVTASLFENKYVFEKTGFFRPKIDIIDLNAKKIIGTIAFKTFRLRAHIYVAGDIFEWKFSNMMYSKWTLKNASQTIELSSQHRKEGQCIIHNKLTSLLLLSALIIRNHFKKSGYA